MTSRKATNKYQKRITETGWAKTDFTRSTASTRSLQMVLEAKWVRGKGMGLTQTTPIFTSFGPSTPDLWIHREIHKTFYTEDYFCFHTLPDQALWGLPRWQELKLTIYLPSSQHHPLGPPWLLPTPEPSHWETWDQGIEREEEEEGGKRQSWTPSPRPAQLGPSAAAPPHLNCCPLEKFQAETQNTAIILL